MLANVLLVDNEETVTLTLSEILAREGYAVEVANSTPEALDRITRGRFELAVLDLRLGDDSGLTVLSHLRETSPQTVALVLTGYGSLETARSAIRQGACDYLLKPCDVEELRAALARGLEQQRRAQLAHKVEVARAELDRALRARDDFLLMIGHELKTPASVVVSWAQLVQRRLQRGTADGAAEGLETVIRQARRLARLVDIFADIARAGMRDAGAEVVDLREVARAPVERARATFPAHTFGLELPEQPIRGRCVPLQLEYALDNLIENAARFSAPGSGVQVRLDAAADGAERTATARISVCDEGLGLSADRLATILDRFNADAARPTDGSSHGIGLWISRTLAELNGGRLEAASDGPGKGSTFTLVLPLER